MNPQLNGPENTVVPFPKRDVSAPSTPKQSGPGEVIAFPHSQPVRVHESVAQQPSLNSIVLDNYAKERKQETVQEQERLIRLVFLSCEFAEKRLALARDSSLNLSAEIADMYAERIESFRAFAEKISHETASGLSREELVRLQDSPKRVLEIIREFSVYVDTHSA